MIARCSVLLPPRALLARSGERLLALELMWVCGNPVEPLNADGGFTVFPNAWSEAAISRQNDCKDARGFNWMRADPAWVRAELSSARLMALGDLQLNDAQVRLAEKKLKPLFGDSGFEFSAPHPSRWFVRAPSESALPRCGSPDLALGDHIDAHLPQGNNAARWRALLNEAQIILHHLPFNAEREAQGLPPLNSLWFHGPGALPERVSAPFDRVLSHHERLLGLSQFANIHAQQPADMRALLDIDAKDLLLDLRHLRDLDELHLSWAFPLLEAVKSKRIKTLDWHFESDQANRFESRHRWRFWRKPKPFTAA